MKLPFLLYSYCLCLLLNTSSCAAQVEHTAVVTDQQQAWVTAIEELTQQYVQLDIFSGVVLVAEEGQPFLQRAYGLANRETTDSLRQNTLFDIGSMNKTMTEIVIYQLIEEGKLKLDDLLINYITGFEDQNVAFVTVEHLLTHTSGFGEYHWPGYVEAPAGEKSIAAVTERAKHMQLLFPPGETDEYSNTGYILLGAIIEKITRKTYQQNVQERIVAPLGLRNTYVQNLEEVRHRQATAYRKSVFGELIETPSESEVPNPDGGFLSTINDVLQFYHSYYYGDILLSASARELSPQLAHFSGLEDGGLTGNAGGFEGWNTCYLEIKGQGLSILVFANMDEPVAEQIAFGIVNIIKGEEPNLPQLPATQLVAQSYQENGLDFVKANFEKLTANFHPADPRDIILNAVGYAFLYEQESPAAAIDLFQLNTQLFPDIANCWDSLGEAYRVAGNRTAAISAYEQALALDPELDSAKAALEVLNE